MPAKVNVTDNPKKVPFNRLAWSVHAFATAIDASDSFIRLEIRRGKIHPARLGRRVVILDQEAQRYLAAGLEAALR